MLRLAPHTFIAVILTACTFPNNFGDDGNGVVAIPCELDAGFPEDGSEADAGFCFPDDPTREFFDGAPKPDDDDACPPLIVSTCGQNNECQRDPGCVAAELTARFEPERCAEAAADARSYPPCQLGTCTILADKVCGPAAIGGGVDDARGCGDAPGCTPALELLRRADDGDVSADNSCAQALADEVLFPPCQ